MSFGDVGIDGFLGTSNITRKVRVIGFLFFKSEGGKKQMTAEVKKEFQDEMVVLVF